MGYKETKMDACKTQIVITRLLEDDDSGDRPDERDEGFYPSLDASAAGYVGAGNEHDYNRQMDIARRRIALFDNGIWNYVGVRAVANISIAIGGNSICTYQLKSAGLWGIESDSEESYLQEVFEEQAEELRAHIAAMASAPVTIVNNA